MKPLLALLAAASLAPAVSAQSFVGTVEVPAIDRWWYPFNTSGGAEPTCPIFAALGQTGFDDRDAQFVIAFETTDIVPAGKGPGRYDIHSLCLRVVTSNAPRFAYDPSVDSVRTSYATTDPEFLVDDDSGKPIELFAAGYRNNLTAATLAESTAFSTTPTIPPQESIRSAFAASLSPDGLPTADVSNHATQRVEAQPLAVGRNPTLVVGELVPTGSELLFVPDLTNPASAAYLARGLDAGRIVFVVSSLHPAAGGPGGGGGDPQYPAFYTKENALAPSLPIEPSLDLNVDLRPIVDFNNDGLFPDIQDIEDLITVFAGGTCPGLCSSIDINGDGILPDAADIETFLCIFAGGNC